MLNKVVIILRGVPGNGKTTVAEYIKQISSFNTVICCADDYFTDELGNYNYDQSKIYLAHLQCQNIFKNAIIKEQPTIIVANTNVREKDVNLYKKLAEENGYLVIVLTVENWHNGKDIHNVPDDVKSNMKVNLLNSIKL